MPSTTLPWQKAFWWAVALAYMAFIFHLSSQSSLPTPTFFPHQDKLFHLGAYLILGMFLAYAAPGPSQKKRFWLAFALASVYGISDELHQSFVPGRDASSLDWLADTLGGWLGAYLALSSEGLFRRAWRRQ